MRSGVYSSGIQKRGRTAQSMLTTNQAAHPCSLLSTKLSEEQLQKKSVRKKGLSVEKKGFQVPQGRKSTGVTGFQQSFLQAFEIPACLLCTHTPMTFMTAASEHLTVFHTLIFPAPLLSTPAVTALVYSKYRDQRLEPQKYLGIALPSTVIRNVHLAAPTALGQVLLQYPGKLRGVQEQATVLSAPHRDCNT